MNDVFRLTWRALCPTLRGSAMQSANLITPANVLSKSSIFARIHLTFRQHGRAYCTFPREVNQQCLLRICQAKSNKSVSLRSQCGHSGPSSSKLQRRPFAFGSRKKSIEPEASIGGFQKNSSSSIRELSPWVIKEIFGSTVSPSMGNRILAILQHQRETGTLDAGIPEHEYEVEEYQIMNAISWLRANYPIDEDSAIEKRLNEEDAEAIKKAERAGLWSPQQDVEETGLYGHSTLEEIRKRNLERSARQQEEKAKKEDEQAKWAAENPELALQRGSDGAVVTRKRTESQWVQRYRQKAMAGNFNVPPEMSKWGRLWPSAAVTALVIAFAILFAQNYTPPPKKARLWPDLPPALATVLGLIAINAVCWYMWKPPPCWIFMNKYFIIIPGLPKALSMIGGFFSHQTFAHLGANMIALGFVGTRLCHEIGRGDFLAVYVSSGVISSFMALFMPVMRRNFAISSLGASGAVCGIVATYFTLNSDKKAKVVWLPDGWELPPISGSLLLLAMISVDVVGASKGWTKYTRIDHWAHLGGYATGIASAQILNRKARQRRQAERERKKKPGFVGRIKEGRL